MARKLLNRFSHPFLSFSFPENIIPSRKLNKKSEKIIQYKKRLFGKTAKAAQNNIIKQSLLALYLQQNKKNLVKSFDLDNLWLQNPQHQLLQQRLFTLIQTLKKRAPNKGFFSQSFSSKKQNNDNLDKASKMSVNANNFSGRQILTLFKKQNRKLSFLFALAQLKLELSKKKGQFINPLFSDYKMRFLERKKLSFFYGNLTKKQLQKARKQAKNSHSRTAEKFLSILESRLDVTLYRISFSDTILAARQLITHSKIIVNGVIINQPGFLLKPGDTLSIIDAERKKIKNQILQRLIDSKVSQLNLQQGTLKNAPLFFYRTLKKINSVKNFTTFNSSFVSRANKKFNDFLNKKLKAKRILNLTLKKNKLFLLKNLLFNSKGLIIPFLSATNCFKLFSEKSNFKLDKAETKGSVEKNSSKKENSFFFFNSTNVEKFYYQSGLRKKETTFTLIKNNETKKKVSKSYSAGNPSSITLSSPQYSNLFKNLRIQRFLYKKRPRNLVKHALRLNPMKPLHLEVSYTLLTAIFLYSPQKLVFPGSVDLDLVFRELQS